MAASVRSASAATTIRFCHRLEKRKPNMVVSTRALADGLYAKRGLEVEDHPGRTGCECGPSFWRAGAADFGNGLQQFHLAEYGADRRAGCVR